MEDEHCPECGNEIYKPYIYCNACGWDKNEEDEEKEQKEQEPKSKKGSKKKSDKKSKKDTTEKSKEPKEPMKITCKCGTTFKVKSTKRPLKIKCPKCGKTGVLKDKPKKPDADEITEKKKVGDKKKRKEKGVEKDKPKHKPKPGRSEVAPSKKRRIDEKPSHKPKRCPECDARLKESGLCPECGYRVKSRPKEQRRGPSKKGPSPARMERRDRGRTKSKPRPPKDARVVKPRKGVCSSCGSRNLRFYDDGSGRCPNCGREFNWDGGSSRLQQEEYLCQRCGDTLEFIDEYESWYCHSCKEYA